MQRVCFVLQVRPDRLVEYKRRHAEVWPEMLSALRETGWHNYSLFLGANGLLVGYFETPNLQQALAAMKSRTVNELWQQEMAQFIQSPNSEKPDDQLMPLEEIFHLSETARN